MALSVVAALLSKLPRLASNVLRSAFIEVSDESIGAGAGACGGGFEFVAAEGATGAAGEPEFMA